MENPNQYQSRSIGGAPELDWVRELDRGRLEKSQWYCYSLIIILHRTGILVAQNRIQAMHRTESREAGT